MGGAAFGSFLVVFGELPSGRPSIFGKSLETPGGLFYVGMYAMSKLFGFFCSGASRQSEVGGEQAVALGDQALGSIASEQSR